MLVTMTVLMVIAAPGANEAEDLFKKMEGKVHDAKSLEFESATTMEGKIQVTLALKATLAQGNKAHFIMEAESGEKTKSKVTIFSNGKKMQMFQGDKPGKTEETPKNLTPVLSALLTRMGTPLTGIRSGPDNPLTADKFDKEQFLVLSDFKLGKKEKLNDTEAQAISYKVKVAPNKDLHDVTVWVDTKTNLPVKWVMLIKEGNESVTATVTVKTFKLSDKVEDKRFELPKE